MSWAGCQNFLAIEAISKPLVNITTSPVLKTRTFQGQIIYLIKDEQFELNTEVVRSGILLSWFEFVASSSFSVALGEISKLSGTGSRFKSSESLTYF